MDDENDPKAASSPPRCIATEVETTSNEVNEKSQDAIMSDVENEGKIDSAKKLFLDGTADYGVPQLERLYTRIVKGVFELKIVEHDDHRPPVLNFLLKFAENKANF